MTSNMKPAYKMLLVTTALMVMSSILHIIGKTDSAIYMILLAIYLKPDLSREKP